MVFGTLSANKSVKKATYKSFSQRNKMPTNVGESMPKISLPKNYSEKQVVICAELSDLVYKEDGVRSTKVKAFLQKRGLELVCTSTEYFRNKGTELLKAASGQLRAIGGIDLSKLLTDRRYQEKKAAQLRKIGSKLTPAFEKASSYGYFAILVKEIDSSKFYLANIGTRPSAKMIHGDLQADVALVFDKPHPQFQKAIDFVIYCRDKYLSNIDGINCIPTGHSKAVPILQLQAHLLNTKCVGFEGPFLSPKILSHYIPKSSARDKVDMLTIFSNPNPINGLNYLNRTGTVLHVDPLRNQGLGEISGFNRILLAHRMGNIIKEIKQGRFYSEPQEPCIKTSFSEIYNTGSKACATLFSIANDSFKQQAFQTISKKRHKTNIISATQRIFTMFGEKSPKRSPLIKKAGYRDGIEKILF